MDNTFSKEEQLIVVEHIIMYVNWPIPRRNVFNHTTTNALGIQIFLWLSGKIFGTTVGKAEESGSNRLQGGQMDRCFHPRKENCYWVGHSSAGPAGILATWHHNTSVEHGPWQ